MDAVERAVARLEPGSTIVEVGTLVGGVSAEVHGVVLDTAAGERRRLVFRRHPDGLIAKEFGVLRALHGAGLAVPEPYLLDPPSMLQEWVEGSTAVGAGGLDDALDQLAGFLAALHALDPAAVGLAGLDGIEDPLVELGAFLPAGDAGERVRAALDAGTIAAGTDRAVLLHGDYWPGNVLWRDGRLVAVIDWEDACLGDPLADLATARVELLCLYGAEAMDRFTARYLAAAGPVGLDGLVGWELYVSAAALSAMGGWGLDVDDEARRRTHTTAFFERAAGEL